jgi:hypothetical protein
MMIYAILQFIIRLFHVKKAVLIFGLPSPNQGEHLNAVIYNKNVMSQAQNLKNPIKS